MVSSGTHPVDVLDQNRQPLTNGTLEITGTTGMLKPAEHLEAGVYFLRFTGGGIRGVRAFAPEADGRLPVESRDYPYRLEVA